MQYDSQPGVGGTFITDINPTSTGTVSNKVYEDGVVMLSCDSDCDDVTVSVLALSGSSHLIPRVTVNDILITNFTLNAQMRYTGTADITLSGSGDITISVDHEDGGHREVILSKVAGPVISALSFTGSYPGSQTELKSGDTFSISISADVDANRIEVENFEACSALAQDLTGSGPYTVVTTIANRGSGTQANQRCRVRLRGTNGIWGEWVNTDIFGSGDASAYVQLNNDVPVVSVGTITYPASQGALKGSETATVVNTVTFPSGVGTVLYSSPNSDLSVSNTTTYETPKTVTRIAGSYNITTTNFRVVATKTSNAATTTANGVVFIANTACTLAVTEPAARLRSGGNVGTSAQNHTITITASQRLYAAPTLVAPVGTWQGAAFAGSTTVWTRSLQIHDDDAKGVQNWGAISGTNLAGIATTAITGNATYEIGGFVSRTLTVAAWPNRETAIGTRVVNTAKLTCLNNSKGVGYAVTFQATIADAVDKYTITDPSATYNAIGNLLYNADISNSVANASGTATFTLEEIV